MSLPWLLDIEFSSQRHCAGEAGAGFVAAGVQASAQLISHLGPHGDGAVKVHISSVGEFARLRYRGYALVRYRAYA